MRFSPTKILQGLLCTTPLLVLLLAACGGGGGGGGSSTPPLAAAYTLSVSVSGVNASGVMLHNGGDDLTAASGVHPFAHQVIAGTSYNISVLAQPSSPTQLCTVATPTGIMPAYNKTVAVNCVDAWTIGGTFTGAPPNNGLVLQNNGADNYLVPAGATSFVFATPVVASTTVNYTVTVLAQPHAQTCTTDTSASGVTATDVTNVAINCANNTTPPPADPYVYAANIGSTGSNGVSAYTSDSSGVLSAPTMKAAGSGPSSIAVAAGQFAYVTNYISDTISAYRIDSVGALTSTDADGATAGIQAIATGTGTHPYAIAIHPSGKFAYVANYADNSVSAYSIDSAGALSKIDADGTTAGNQASIAARAGPVAIAIDPAGAYAYVANANDSPGSVSVYRIDATTGALTAIPAGGGGTPTYISTGGTTPYSVAVEPDGTHLFVANRGSNTVTVFQIGGISGPGTLNFANGPTTGTTPVSIAIHPAGGYAYVVNTGSDSVSVYSISGSALTPLPSVSTGTQPSSISIDSTGQYAYVTNYGDNTIWSYSINLGTGNLTPKITQSTGTGPNAVTTAR